MDCSLNYINVDKQYIVIGDNTSTIGNAYNDLNCFPNTVVIPKKIGGVPVLAIGANAYRDRDRVKKIHIYAPITHLYEGAIRNLNFLTEIILPPTIIYLGPHCFHDCDRLNIIVFPFGSSLQYAGENTFTEGREGRQVVQVIHYCGKQINTDNFLEGRKNISIKVPPGGPSTFLGLPTSEEKGICQFEQLGYFFPKQRTDVCCHVTKYTHFYFIFILNT